MPDPRPLIVDIKRHSLEDGPGIRTVVFFKGCPLRCRFCHNPETQRPEPELAFHARTCIACGRCAAVCPQAAIDLDSDVRLRRDRCDLCGRCAAVCPSGALRRVGRPYALDELVDILLLDEPFYRHSGGGVTLSGGEPTFYPDYLQALLEQLKARGLHVLIETAGEFDGDLFCRCILPFVDLIYFDVKIADPELHRRYTGRDNRRILANLDRLLRLACERVVPRLPLVPGITATQANLEAVVALLRASGAAQAVLLPYNPLGQEKAADFGYPEPAVPGGFMPRETEEALCAQFEALVRRASHHAGGPPPSRWETAVRT
jgi:pyruvate formate lyase activating enzyme